MCLWLLIQHPIRLSCQVLHMVSGISQLLGQLHRSDIDDIRQLVHQFDCGFIALLRSGTDRRIVMADKIGYGFLPFGLFFLLFIFL